ncbi:MAG: LCP family protein [Coriobacteriales bacterium]|nr:LCP family protein [Coriobacteriales bacterium]
MPHENHPLSREQSLDYYAGVRARKSRRKLVIGIVVGIVSVLAIAGIAAGLYFAHINSNISTTDQDLLASLKKGAPNEPFYLLLIGADRDEERSEEAGGSEDENFRADTIMLCRIDPKDGKVTLLSIHRDLYVDLEDGTKGKINAAFSLGGPSGMVRQVSKLAGVDISHYVELDFDAFMSIVDAVGGVEITLPRAISDPDYTGIDLEAGTHVLDSWDALMLSRARHAYDEYGDGDLYRAANQRAIIASIIRKVLASSPQEMISSITAMSSSLTTDMSLDEILALASQFRDFNTDEDMYTGMTPSEPLLIDDIYYEILDEPAWNKIMQRVDAGLPPYEDEEDDPTSGVASSTSSHPTVPSDDEQEDGKAKDKDAGSGKKDAGSLESVDKSGAIAVAGYVDGRASKVADDLASMGFTTVAYEEDDFVFDKNLVVYGDPAHQEEAEALAAYLGDDYQAILNDGSFYLMSDIVVRMAM